MKNFVLIVSLICFSIVINAQKIDTTTTYQWDTTTHQFVNSAQQIFKYNGACYLTQYSYSFWDTATANYGKYYKSTNSLLANNATSQILNQIWDEATNKWGNYQKVNYTYTTNPNLPSSVIYQTWQFSNSSFVNSSQYFYTYDSYGNNTITVIKDWNATTSSWVNSFNNQYTYNSKNQIQSFLQLKWNAINSSWNNYNQYNYSYNTFNKEVQDSGMLWDKSTSKWINLYRNTYFYDTNNLMQFSFYDVWDTALNLFKSSQKYIYKYSVSGNLLETLTLNWNDSTWDTLYNDVNHYNSCKILPVDLISFNAKKNNNNVDIYWRTANEIDLNRFNIQRTSILSTDYSSFITFDSIKANNYPSKYSIYDLLNKNESKKEIYYRLEMINNDGSKTYSPIQHITLNSNDFNINVFPNPVTSVINIIGNELSQVTIKDILGRILFNQKYNGNISSIQIPSHSFSKGIVLLEIMNNDGYTKTKKLIIQ